MADQIISIETELRKLEAAFEAGGMDQEDYDADRGHLVAKLREARRSKGQRPSGLRTYSPRNFKRQ